MKTIVAALVLTLAMPVQAAEWWYITSNDDIFIVADSSSIVNADGKLKVWTQTVLRVEKDKVKSRFVRMIVDCKELTLSYGAVMTKDAKGNTLFSKFDSVTAPKEVGPETQGDDIVKSVCIPLDRWPLELAKLPDTPIEAATRTFAAFPRKSDK